VFPLAYRPEGIAARSLPVYVVRLTRWEMRRQWEFCSSADRCPL